MKQERNAPCVWQRDRQRDAQEGIECVALLLAVWAGEGGPAGIIWREQDQNTQPNCGGGSLSAFGTTGFTCTEPGRALGQRSRRTEGGTALPGSGHLRQ